MVSAVEKQESGRPAGVPGKEIVGVFEVAGFEVADGVAGEAPILRQELIQRVAIGAGRNFERRPAIGREGRGHNFSLQSMVPQVWAVTAGCR